MANPFLSGRIPAELHQQINEFLARTGETKTEMLARAVAAYIGAEAPPLKATGDRRIENLEREVGELKGAVKSLYEKFATFTPKIKNSKVEHDNSFDNNDNLKEIDEIDHTTSDIDNTINNNHNHVETEKADTADNIIDNNDNIPEVTSPTHVIPTIDDDKTFTNIDTAEVARLTKIDSKRITDLRGAFNRKLKKQNQILPEKQVLNSPIKITTQLELKIAKISYEIFYVGQSKAGKNLWNLVPKEDNNLELPLKFNTDNI